MNNNTDDSNTEPGSIYTIKIPKEYRSVVEDICRMIMIQFTANMLFYMSDSRQYPLFGVNFLKTMLFIIVGVALYWLVFRKIISFGDCVKGESFWYGSEC